MKDRNWSCFNFKNYESDDLKETSENIQNISKSGGVSDPHPLPLRGPCGAPWAHATRELAPGWERVFFVTRDGTQIISVMRDRALI